MKVVFFGDSICFGQYVSPHETWVTRLSCELTRDLAPTTLNVKNSSISGNTTRMALERMPYDVQAQGVDILVVQFGMNDCNYWQTDHGEPRVSPNAFGANLEEIIARGRAFGAKSIFLLTNHPSPRTERFSHAKVSYQQSNERYCEIIRQTSERTGSFLIDIDNEWKKRLDAHEFSLEELLLPDGIHLSKKGHDLYFEITYPILSRAVALVSTP